MLYDYLPKWRESYERLGDFTMWGYQNHTFIENYKHWHDLAWRTRNENEKICLFSNMKGIGFQEGTQLIRREIRALPGGLEFSNSLWIHGEFVIIGMTRQRPHYAYQLFDPVLSKNLRTMFQLLWKLTEKI